MTTIGLGATDTKEVEALMPGVENSVRFLGIKPEYKVLVGCNTKTNPALIEAVSTTIRGIGSELTILVADPPERGKPTPKVIMEAAKSVDYYVQVGLGPGPHSRDFYILLFDYGVSAGFLTMDEPNLTEDIGTYPFEVWGEIHNRLKWKLGKNEVDPGKTVEFHATDERGTDLRWKVKFPIDIGAWIGPEPLDTGYWVGSRPRVMHRAGFGAFFLTMGDLQYTATGKLHVDATNFLGATPEPIVLNIENGRCTGMEGGELAEKLWDLAVGDFRNGDRVRELAVAIHPKSNRPMPEYHADSPIPVAPIPRISYGDFSIALGGDTGVGGVDPGAEDATSLFTMSKQTTITADGEKFLDRGKLLILEDPELREFAAKYGDPDYLLSPVEGKD
jgi:2,5-dihydroxypyridine 5,6-dioxygenase